MALQQRWLEGAGVGEPTFSSVSTENRPGWKIYSAYAARGSVSAPKSTSSSTVVADATDEKPTGPADAVALETAGSKSTIPQCTSSVAVWIQTYRGVTAMASASGGTPWVDCECLRSAGDSSSSHRKSTTAPSPPISGRYTATRRTYGARNPSCISVKCIETLRRIFLCER